ncbi:FAD-binding oxidoreductase [Rhizobium leguminosarum]|uniref:NAD(P)/FAD-dependent oxidoreductase n=1 Tax=Rhizobium leguminosarum TaxID=384 RepID=UPI001C964E48|nr:FAD-binding oxidoreductase [Rhizobium leguminosarum]MBY5544920.1 FAD-binding oxidoreductase [Rhizobium leguminosarum]
MTKNAIVLGAGIVGVSTAIHLQRRGRQVTLIDRKDPGNETSFGNAGLIQREGVAPYGFPQQLGLLLRYALNNRIDAHYHLRTLPSQIAFLARYWWNSNARRHAIITRAYAPLIENSIAEHKDLIEASQAEGLIRKDGWIKIFRTEAKRDQALAEAALWQNEFGVEYDSLTSADIARMEPDMTGDFAGGIHWRDPWSVLDPHALTSAYRRYFESLGGRFVTGDAASLGPFGSGWKIMTAEGPLEAEDAVIALGPWAAPKTPVQLDRAEAVARTIFPLGGRLDPEPWMGARPCTPDMMPVIGKAPRHQGLWFAFGHAHHGLTLGPVTGRVLAELITGETPFIDIAAYSPQRFNP